MIVDVLAQEVAASVTDEQQQFIAMQDMELMYVGGGGASGVLF